MEVQRRVVNSSELVVASTTELLCPEPARGLLQIHMGMFMVGS